MLAIFRLFQIVHILCFYHLDELLKPLPHSIYIRALFKLHPAYWMYFFSEKRKYSLEQRCRLALVELGPVFIKLGQLAATRRDLLNDALADELEQLTENVPPFDSEQALSIIKQELSETCFAQIKSIDALPLAAASIAQVHAAQLQSGEQVVFKILRPNIEKTVRRDVRLMAWLASSIESVFEDARLFYLSELVENYRVVIEGEMNFYREAANTIKMRNNALKHDYLYIPRVYLDFSTRKVLCMERIYGIPVNQAEKISAQGTDLEKLAENGVKIFFTQVFKDNFFHADMHPGNIFVNTVNPSANQYVSVDCAIAGSLSREDQSFLAQQLLAVIQKKYERNAQLLIDAGWVRGNIHKEELALRLQKIVEPVFDQAMSDIEFAPILMELLAMAREFHIHINPDFLLFQKTLIHIEGLGKQLYPELNVWEIGKPLLEDWVKEMLSPVNLAKALQHNAPELLQQLPELPHLLFEALNRLKQPESEYLREQFVSLQKQQRSANRGVLLAVSLLAGAAYLGSGVSLASPGLPPLILAGLGFSVLGYQFLKK